MSCEAHKPGGVILSFIALYPLGQWAPSVMTKAWQMVLPPASGVGKVGVKSQDELAWQCRKWLPYNFALSSGEIGASMSTCRPRRQESVPEKERCSDCWRDA